MKIPWSRPGESTNTWTSLLRLFPGRPLANTCALSQFLTAAILSIRKTKGLAQGILGFEMHPSNFSVWNDGHPTRSHPLTVGFFLSLLVHPLSSVPLSLREGQSKEKSKSHSIGVMPPSLLLWCWWEKTTNYSRGPSIAWNTKCWPPSMSGSRVNPRVSRLS